MQDCRNPVGMAAGAHDCGVVAPFFIVCGRWVGAT